MSFRKVVKLVALIPKAPEISEEEFMHHFVELHGKKATDSLLRYGLIDYRQVNWTLSTSLLLT